MVIGPPHVDESGEAALDFYSEWKTIYIDYSDRLQRAQIDNAD